MCVGENLAPQAIRYMNAQLGALYDNALECVRTHSPKERPAEETKYSHGLAEWSFVDHTSRDGHPMFHAEFDKPRVDFICNHHAALRIRIIDGHYHLNHIRGARMVYPDSEAFQKLSDIELTFRVDFTTRELRGKDTRIGGGQNMIQLVVLDLLKAQLVATSVPVIIGRDALIYYLEQYLGFLHHAGNHVLFSLPDFDDERYRLTIDYSLSGTALLDVFEVHNIAVDEINAYLSSQWLKVAMLAGNLEEEVVDWKLTTLAEYRSYWSLSASSDFHFHVKLGAPRVRAICSREVILYFNIDEVLFYNTSNFDLAPSQRYTGWEIALVVDVIYERGSEGHVTRCKLDLSTVRVYHQHCKFLEIDETDEIALTYCDRLVDFFSSTYLEVLETVEYTHIYHRDTRWPTVHNPSPWSPGGTSSITWGYEEEVEEDIQEWTISTTSTTKKVQQWKETITQCNMFGFDQIVAISQSSVNAYFEYLFTLGLSSRNTDHWSWLTKWDFKEFFTTELKPLKIRLLSNGRAIVWVHLERGELKILKNKLPWTQSERYSFESWQLAFEVDIKKCVHSELKVHETWTTKYKDTLIWKEHGNREDRYIEHIYLDFNEARFLHEFSTFDSLFSVQDHLIIDKVRAAVYYVRNEYFPHIAFHGLNIIHSQPIWLPGAIVPSFALTSSTFHVYSKVEITRQNWAQVVYEPAVVILGMTSFHPLPALRLEYSASWVIRAAGGLSRSTVCISRAAFMEERLLRLLSRINAQTTIIPLFTGIENDRWILELTTWSEHVYKRNVSCDWQLVGEGIGHTKYQWQHRDAWKYEHEGSREISGIYAVSSYTNNYVELPSAIRSRVLEVKIGGEVGLELSFGSPTRNGRSKAVARWNSVLSIVTEVEGLKVKVSGNPILVIDDAEFIGDVTSGTFINPQAKLRAHLPKAVDFTEVLAELKVFEGVWNYAYPGTQPHHLGNPVFNLNGDIIFELLPQSQPQLGQPKPHRQVSSGGIRPSGITRVSSRGTHRTSSYHKSVKESVTSTYGLQSPDSPAPKIRNGVVVVQNGSASANGNGINVNAGATLPSPLPTVVDYTERTNGTTVQDGSNVKVDFTEKFTGSDIQNGGNIKVVTTEKVQQGAGVAGPGLVPLEVTPKQVDVTKGGLVPIEQSSIRVPLPTQVDLTEKLKGDAVHIDFTQKTKEVKTEMRSEQESIRAVVDSKGPIATGTSLPAPPVLNTREPVIA